MSATDRCPDCGHAATDHYDLIGCGARAAGRDCPCERKPGSITGPDSDLPALSYGGDPPNSGWSGTATSRARAERRDSSGQTLTLQSRVLNIAAEGGHRGTIIEELRNALPQHHGSLSSTLTNLHIKGRLVRLVEERDGCAIYVLPDHVNGREEDPYAPRRVKLTKAERDAVQRARDAADGGMLVPGEALIDLLAIIERATDA